jgi:hypothetical protein
MPCILAVEPFCFLWQQANFSAILTENHQNQTSANIKLIPGKQQFQIFLIKKKTSYYSYRFIERDIFLFRSSMEARKLESTIQYFKSAKILLRSAFNSFSYLTIASYADGSAVRIYQLPTEERRTKELKCKSCSLEKSCSQN